MTTRTDKKLILIGAPKSGTTSLAHWLNQHPAIQLGAIKEPRYFTDFKERNWAGPRSDYFVRRLAKDRERYESLYENDKGAHWGLDASTDYLSCEASPALIKEFSQSHEVKLICVLRDPVERAFSEYAHTIRQDLQRKTFLQSLEIEEERIASGWIPLFHHARRSRYAAGLQAFRNQFDDRSLIILPFEDLRDEAASLSRIEQFLGIEPHQYDTAEMRNVSKSVRSRTLKSLMKNDNPVRRLARRYLPRKTRSMVRSFNETRLAITREEATAFYQQIEDDIALAQTLVPFNAEHWTRR